MFVWQAQKMMAPGFVESKCRRGKGGRGEGMKRHDAYVNVMMVVWCLSSNFYIDATFRLL